MSAERHARVKALFHAALDRPGDAREPFLVQQCGDDVSMLQELREMLAVEGGTPAFLGATAAEELLSTLPSAPRIEQFGPFRVLGLLGEGGMGAVYEAEQDRPHRKVALKVLHPAMGTPQMLRRFELESEVLGRLEHPGIARIYEAGANDTGRGPQPWFAMELVAGEPLTGHCARRALPLAARIELVARVADAIHHAHQRGIVHRDIKPANVLVDATGQPKVLDFGIARVTDGDLQRATLCTDPGMVIGTLQYMSPEQARADQDAIDVRTDVYSLGVILYELVAGQPPLDLARVPLHEALRRVLELEPAPLGRTGVRVPADVAVIAHKALAKDKDRRYASAAEFAADLRRFLRHEPIAALPPSNWYRLQRFSARNKALVGGIAATVVALILGLTVALWQRNEAREALARAEGINRFLLTDLLASPSPERLGRDVRVVDVLAPAVRSAERTFAGQPRVAAEVLDGVGASYRALGLIPEAERVTRRALELLGDGNDRLTLRARGHLIGVLTELDRAEEAVVVGESVVAASVRAMGSEDPDTLARRADLAIARWDAGQTEQSIADLRAVGRDQRRVLGGDDQRTLATHAQLAINLAASGAIAEAQELLGSTFEVQQRVLGPEHPGTLSSRSHLAWMLTLGSSWQEADAMYADLLPAFEAVYGGDHPYTAITRVERVQCALHLGRVDAADEMVRSACADLARRLGPDHAWTLSAHLMLAEVLFEKRDYPAAIAESGRVVERRRAGGQIDENLGHALIKLGRCHQEAGDNRTAAAAFQEAAGVYRQAFGKPTDFLAQALYNLGVATRDAGDAAAAIEPLQEALALDIEHWGVDHRHVVADRYNLARTLLAAARPGEAAEQMRIALPVAEALDLEPARRLGYRGLLGQALLALGQTEAAERDLVAVIDGFAALGRADDRAAQRARAGLVQLYEQQGRIADAARVRDGGH